MESNKIIMVSSTSFIESNALDYVIWNNAVILKLCKSEYRIWLPFLRVSLQILK